MRISIMRHPEGPPGHTPEHLQNSINALKAVNSSDKRIDTYREMMPKARKRYEDWQKREERRKIILRRTGY